MLRRIGVVGGVFAGIYVVSLGYRSLAPAPRRTPFPGRSVTYVPQSTDERREVFDNIAPRYDQVVRCHEAMGGVNAHRKELIKHARGKVLEVGVGTGRNLSFYNIANVTSIVACDTSDEMLTCAKNKYQQMMSEGEARSVADQISSIDTKSSIKSTNESTKDASSQSSIVKSVPIADSIAAPSSLSSAPPPSIRSVLPPITFISDSASSLPFASCTFDTVVDTYGLCSYADPASALSEMLRVVRNDGGGRILLLEHGRCGSSDDDHNASIPTMIVNRYLEYRRVRHARLYGCELTRDMDRIVAELGDDVKIVEKRVFHAGTGYMYVIAVKKKRRIEGATTNTNASLSSS